MYSFDVVFFEFISNSDYFNNPIFLEKKKN